MLAPNCTTASGKMWGMEIIDYLGGEDLGGGKWNFRLGRELHGAFGGANGGVVAAVSVLAARSVAPGRIPAGLDVRFVRGLTAGAARVQTEVLSEGRTLSVVRPQIFDESGKLCTHAVVTLVAPEALAAIDEAGSARPPDGWVAHGEGRRWAKPKGVEIPLIETFAPAIVGRDDKGFATAIRIPWTGPAFGAESACVAADISVGPPVGSIVRGKPVPTPNPDLSLRFCGDFDTPRTLVGAARLEAVHSGLATTRIEVWSDDTLYAVGVSTTTMLAGNWPGTKAGTTSTTSQSS